MRYWDAAFAFAIALAVTIALTPLSSMLARRIGAISWPSERGLSKKATPQLGGLAILAGVLVAALIFVPDVIHVRPPAHAGRNFGGTVHVTQILIGAVVITLVGAVDDWRPLAAPVKLAGQVVAAVIAVQGGVSVNEVALPFVGSLQFPNAGGVLSGIWLVALMNVVNFSDGIDGLAAGLCAIDGVAFAVIIFNLPGGAPGAAVLAALTAGASAGFLWHNFPPARVFMGDCGANLLGYLLGVTAVIGSLKTPAVVALAAPLLILAVPFLDTSFVVAKRLKYGHAPWAADANHFHHRMERIGFSQRKTVAYLYAWTLMLAGVALLLRFVPYTDHNGRAFHLHLGWSIVMGAILLLALAASVYLVYVLEILKFRGRRRDEMLSHDPDTTEFEIDEQVRRELETGEFEAGRD